ncbi:MAG TPA: hypothetical protein G4O08_02435 [Anaerolineae bacterium]|nr:hypothetical protein [Anaerolineae bacterium]
MSWVLVEEEGAAAAVAAVAGVVGGGWAGLLLQVLEEIVSARIVATRSRTSSASPATTANARSAALP